MTAADMMGSVIGGKYRLVERLGVEDEIERHRGEHTAIRRAVELCCLAPGAPSDGSAAARLVRSARVLGSATHRNVQGVLDSGRDAGGRPYVVLEPLRGERLTERFAARAELSPARVARIALQIVEALRALHGAGAVLRTLGPDDVVIELVGATDERVKLRGSRGAAILGSDAEPIPPADSPYLAPELRAGGLGLDPRVDLYSAGVLVRQLFTGAPDGPLDALSDTARRALTRACAEDPDERFASAEGFLQALALLLPTPARPAREQMPSPRDPLQADLHYLHLRRTTRHGTRVDLDAESRLSLLPVLLTIEAIYRRFGPGVWAQICERAEDAETLLPGAGHTPVHMERGVRVALFSEVLIAVDQVAGRGDLALLTELGEAVAKRGLSRLFPDLPEPLTPDGLVSAWPYLWSRIGRDGKARVTRRAPGRARLSVEQQVTPSLELTGLMAGLVRAALIESGASEAEVLLIASEALGDARDLYGLAWR